MIRQRENPRGEGHGIFVGDTVNANQHHTRGGAAIFENQRAEILVFCNTNLLSA